MNGVYFSLCATIWIRNLLRLNPAEHGIAGYKRSLRTSAWYFQYWPGKAAANHTPYFAWVQTVWVSQTWTFCQQNNVRSLVSAMRYTNWRTATPS